jgi:fucose permease
MVPNTSLISELTVVKRRQATLATDLLVLMLAIVLTMLSPLITEITREFSLDKVSTGFIFTSNFIGFAFFILLGGIAADHFGKRLILLIASFSLAICLFLLSISPVYAIISLIVILIGGACGVLESIASAQLAELNPGKEGFHINISQIFFCVGALIGPFGASILISKGWSWREVYRLVGLIALIVSILYLATRYQVNSEAGIKTFSKSDMKALLNNKILILLCICMFLYAGSEIGAWSWMVTFMMEKLQFTIVESSLAVGLFWFAMIIGRMLCTLFLRWFTSKQIVVVLAAVSALTTAFSAFAATDIQAWIATALIGLSYSSIWPLIVAYGSESMQSSSGTVFSLMVGSGGLGSSVIPIMMGFIGQAVSIEFSMFSTVFFFIAIAVIFILLPKIRLVRNSE